MPPAPCAILGSCVFDGLDGKVARITKTTSEFGVQLDSLADLVAFGVVPAVMSYLLDSQRLRPPRLDGRFPVHGLRRPAPGPVQRPGRPPARRSISWACPFRQRPAPWPPWSCSPSTCRRSTCTPWFRWARWCWSTSCPFSWSVPSVFIPSRKSVRSRPIPFSWMVTAILIFSLVASKPKVLGFIIFPGLPHLRPHLHPRPTIPWQKATIPG